MDKKGEPNRVCWNSRVDKCFLEACIQEVSLNGRDGGSLKSDSWIRVKEALKINCNVEFNQRQMKNHYDYLKEKYHLKEKYQAWVPISTKTGNIYNPETDTINWNDEEWAEYIKGLPKARTLKTSPLPFPNLCTLLFDGAAATGTHCWGPSSKNQRPNSSSSFSATNVDLLQNKDILPASSEDDANSHSTPISNSYASKSNNDEKLLEKGKRKFEEGRPRKKKKSNPLEEKMMKELKWITENEECLSKLDRLGWDETSSLYMAAPGIICAGESYRRSWMRLSEDNNLKLENWVKTIGKPLGYMVD